VGNVLKFGLRLENVNVCCIFASFHSWFAGGLTYTHIGLHIHTHTYLHTQIYTHGCHSVIGSGCIGMVQHLPAHGMQHVVDIVATW
jgi:hypothetical protein